MKGEQLDHAIAVFQAAKEGRQIQGRAAASDGAWIDIPLEALKLFDFSGTEYRIKPEPLEGWVWVYDDGSLGDRPFETREFCESQNDGFDGRAVLFRQVEGESE